MFDLNFNIMTLNETLEYILSTNCSISRFGDGEMALMNHFSIPFQKYSNKLSRELRQVYLSRRDDLLICVPEPLMSFANLTEDEKAWWKKELNIFRRIFWIRGIHDWNYRFGNTFFTRPYMAYSDKSNKKIVFDNMKQLWHGRDVCLVEGNKSRVGVGNDLLINANSIVRILGPALNAFDKVDELENYICNNISKDKLILLALGPTASILSYRLSSQGYQSLDVGHLDIEYEWFLMGAKNKVAVRNKYTNEASGGRIVSNSINDELYNTQIIANFSVLD